MNKTIKEIADELQIDKQKVYRYIKANHINEVLREAHQKNNVKYYDEAAQMQIKKAFAAKITSKRSTSKSTSDLHHEALNEALLDTIEMLKNELKIKNEQIEKMHVLLDQEQKLRLVAEDMIHALEDKEEPKKRFFPFWRKN
jgi:hypothetical protein